MGYLAEFMFFGKLLEVVGSRRRELKLQTLTSSMDSETI
jgi:hypothetical protein